MSFYHADRRLKLTELFWGIVGLCLLLTSASAFAAPRGMQNRNPEWTPTEAAYPAGETPDHVTLTMPEDPAVSQSVGWRTSAVIKDGVVQYRELKARDANISEKNAYHVELAIPELINDPVTKHFYADLDNLKPNTAYLYRVGSKSAGKWSPYYKFVTAPVFGAPFSFICLGDIQTDYGLFWQLLSTIQSRHSDINFYLFTGDMVDDGENRNQWDLMLNTADTLFAAKPMAAAMGNHDSHYVNDATQTLIFAEYFHQPHNGPWDLPIHHAYSFAYSNAYFIVLNTNDDTDQQAFWLKAQLAYAREHSYQWLIVMFHHPVYTVHQRRTYTDLQEKWAPLFDEYGVDLVLSGHDHIYMRTAALKNHKPTPEGETGTVYVITNSSDKHYSPKKLPQTFVEIKDIPLYIKIDCGATEEGRVFLRYRAIDLEGRVHDEFRLEK